MDAAMNTTVVRRSAVPAAALLSTWNDFEWRDGLELGQLSALDRLTVRTRHSAYEIVIVSTVTAEILVRGGEFFPEFTPARLAGSSLGGCFLKIRSIHVGFRLELASGGGIVLTSPVASIAIAAADVARRAVM
jgi:hypothetical protein